MRLSMRRFTRLTNAFSKKVENRAAAVALYFMYYNFGRVHQTLRVTPAMEVCVGLARLEREGNRRSDLGCDGLEPRGRLTRSRVVVPVAADMTENWLNSCTKSITARRQSTAR
jgi:hypothetical protein